VLKVGHHGSAASSSKQFLEALAPAYAVISVGGENRFGHPDPDVLERLEGIQILRTDQQGTVEFTTDGLQLWLHFRR
jgi:competence protein ComEC